MKKSLQFEPYHLEEETYFLVKGNCQKESQVNHNMKILALVERSRQMGFQVDRTTHRLWFWLKRIGERDLSLAKTHRFWF